MFILYIIKCNTIIVCINVYFYNTHVHLSIYLSIYNYKLLEKVEITYSYYYINMWQCISFKIFKACVINYAYYSHNKSKCATLGGSHDISSTENVPLQ